jgi:hypothetical protein
MTTQAAHKWVFLTKFRSGAYGWNGSRLACQRLKEALAEIRTVARHDPVQAADGAIRLMEKLWPAFQHIDSSSGALGNATSAAVQAGVDVCVAAPADADTRARWLDRLWEAVEDDGVGFLEDAVDRWGELCASPTIASEWADTFLPTVRELWTNHVRGTYFHGSTACLSCLLAAGRNEELLDLIALAPHVWWQYRQFGVRALAAMGKVDEAITYAQASRGLNDSQTTIDAACEAILLAAGRVEEAYEQFALSATWASTNLATFRAIRKKYPMVDPETNLRDLIEGSPGDEGKWFATAKELGLLELALELASASPGGTKSCST